MTRECYQLVSISPPGLFALHTYVTLIFFNIVRFIVHDSMLSLNTMALDFYTARYGKFSFPQDVEASTEKFLPLL